ncbi:uncharacterized protein BXZ73DRAFT_42334, partial [Epithele typhae]|uniref:uncharacterized protein n=1 Tax=Epithele typhae TaxID=378194 RepID=UPI0020078D84
RRTYRSIPSEVLDGIAESLLAGCHGFSSVGAFSLVSYQFRQVALRRYFAKLRIRSAKRWDACCRIRGACLWVRGLSALSASFGPHVGALLCFINLRYLDLDFSSEGLSTQSARARVILENITAALVVLKIRRLSRIDVILLTLIAGLFPSLSTLELSCTERLDLACCWICYEESSSCVIHSPVPELYPSANHLAKAFGRALQPLQRLKSVFLGVYLSDADMLYRHLDRCAAFPATPSPSSGHFFLAPPFGPDRCDTCKGEHHAVVRERERLASRTIAEQLPSLETIGWSSYFTREEGIERGR